MIASLGQTNLVFAESESALAVIGVAGWGYKTYVGCLVLGTLTSLLLTPVIIKLAVLLDAVDEPGHRKAHGRSVPLLGGLAVFIGMWVPLLVLMMLDNLVTQQLWNRSAHIMVIFAAGVAMLILGAVDDLVAIRARYKLLVQIPVALAVWLADVRFERLDLPVLGELDANLLGPIVSVVWLVGITNAFNLIDGIDGLATGVALFVALTNGFIAVWTGTAVLAVLMFSMAGACLGFLKYNFNPARVFLGDTGSLFLGMTLGITSVATSAKSQVASSFLIALVVLGYPALDTLLAMGQRLLRGKSPFIGDDSHIHHRLLQKGFGHRQSTLVLYAVCLLFCVAAVAIVIRKSALTAFTFMVIGALTAYGLWALGYFRMVANPSLRDDRNMYRANFHFVEMIKAKIHFAKSRTDVLDLLRVVPQELGFQRVRIVLSREQDELPHESLCEELISAGNEPAEEGTATVQHDLYKYPESGLEVEAWIRDTTDSHDLVMERRALLADAFETASRRLVQIRNSGTGPLPASNSARR